MQHQFSATRDIISLPQRPPVGLWSVIRVMRTATQLQQPPFNTLRATPSSERRLKVQPSEELAQAMADALRDILRDETRQELSR